MFELDHHGNDAHGQPVFRFAPSPNGLLHRGHAYSALLNQHLARAAGGRLLLRLEDIDILRCKDDFVDAAIRDLAWLGLSWSGPVRRQSRHFADYGAAIDRLRDLGVIYTCHASRTEIAAAAAAHATPELPHTDPDGAPLYMRWMEALSPQEEARRKAEGAPFSLRLDIRRAMAIASNDLDYRVFDAEGGVETRTANPLRWGDVILVRKDVPASYHLAVVADDELQSVTHVVRGCDLEAATDIHRLLQALLGLPVPLYHHHGLILDDSGDKLAKSRMSRPLAEWRAAGVSAAQLRSELGFG